MKGDQKKWHITIVDNETGEKVYDYDTNAIIGGAENEENWTSICMTDCKLNDLVGTLKAAKNAIKHATSGDTSSEMADFLSDLALKKELNKKEI